MIAQGETNGCKGLRLIDADELNQHVPGVSGIGGMLSSETAIFDPFTYCVALAENAAENGTDLIEKPDFNPTRKKPVRFRNISKAEQAELIEEDPEYGEIMCRCQKVTKR